MPKTEIVTDPQRLVEMLINSEVEVIAYLPINDYTLSVGVIMKKQWKHHQ